MQLRRILQIVALLVFLTVTIAGFVFTMTRVYVPLIPRRLIHFSYGMMAPYQGDVPWNADLGAEGQRADGSWVDVDLDPYYPFEFGEKNVRMHMRSFKAFGDEVRREKFSELAEQLLAHERERGRPYQALRLSWYLWPRSPAGFTFLRHEPFFLERGVLAEVR